MDFRSTSDPAAVSKFRAESSNSESCCILRLAGTPSGSDNTFAQTRESLSPAGKAAIQGLIAERREFEFVEIGKQPCGIDGVVDGTGLSLAETIRLLSSAEYFIGIMSGPIHLAAALDIKLICVTNFPPPELICLPCLKDIDQVESEWFYPQSVILHQDDDGKFVKRLTTENLHRALDGDIYPYWSDRYLELIQD